MRNRFSLKLDRLHAAAALPGLLFCATVAADTPKEVDLALSEIQLVDAQSAKAPFGTPPELDDPDSDRPKAYLCNKDNTERLALVYYEGDTAYVISEFRVEHIATRYVHCSRPSIPVDHFISGKGIALGMSRQQVVRILGNAHNEHPQLDEIVISYRIDNKNESGFLQHYSAPAYFGQYHFKEDRLVSFSFGFEFP